MTTFKPGKLAILAALGVLALGSAACAYDDYGDHHRGRHDGRHDGRGDHHGRSDHRDHRGDGHRGRH